MTILVDKYQKETLIFFVIKKVLQMNKKYSRRNNVCLFFETANSYFCFNTIDDVLRIPAECVYS